MFGILPSFIYIYIYIQSVPRGTCCTLREGYIWQLTSTSRNIPRLHLKSKSYGENDKRKICAYFAVQSTEPL